MVAEFSRFGIFKRADGTLATSICHSRPENAGRGECHHFSFAETAEEIQKKLTFYITERVNGKLDKVDGTAGDYLSAFRNWLILEKHYDASKLVDPKATGSVLELWFDNDEQLYHNMLNEIMETDLMSGIKVDENVKKSADSLLKNDVTFRVMSNPGIAVNDDETVARDTNFWMQSNNMNNGDGTVSDTNYDLNDSIVTALSSGDNQVDVDEVERLKEIYVNHSDNKSTNVDDNPFSSDKLDCRYDEN